MLVETVKGSKNKIENCSELTIFSDTNIVQAQIMSLNTSKIVFKTSENLTEIIYSVEFEVWTIPYKCRIFIKNKKFELLSQTYTYEAEFEGLTQEDINLLKRS